MDAPVRFSRQIASSGSQVISIFSLNASRIWEIFSCGVDLYCDMHMGKPKPKSEKTPSLKTKKKPGPRKTKEKKNFPQEKKKKLAGGNTVYRLAM